MKIWIDIYHLPQLNFYKNLIKSFDPNLIQISTVNRGKLVKIIKHELPDYNLIILGDYKYNKNKLCFLFKIVFYRIFKFFFLINKKNVKIAFSSNYQINLVCWLKGVPNYVFYDDIRKYIFPLTRIVANKVYFPAFLERKKYNKVKYFNSLKEWAYLSPKVFKPNIKILDFYELKPKQYIFIREVDTKTINYLNQKDRLVLEASKFINTDIRVILSLENKTDKILYPKDWIILDEPVEDIHSLMYFSKCIISSGDSMVREGGMLGVPSLYLGFREMPANDLLINKGIIKKIKISEFKDEFESLYYSDFDQNEQLKFRFNLNNEWTDVTSIMKKLIEKEIQIGGE